MPYTRPRRRVRLRQRKKIGPGEAAIANPSANPRSSRLDTAVSHGVHPICYTRRRMNLRLRLGAAWSNHCDPANAQFNLLKTNPIVSFHAQGDVFTFENDSADNSWLCTSPSLSVSHFGDQ